MSFVRGGNKPQFHASAEEKGLGRGGGLCVLGGGGGLTQSIFFPKSGVEITITGVQVSSYPYMTSFSLDKQATTTTKDSFAKNNCPLRATLGPMQSLASVHGK